MTIRALSMSGTVRRTVSEIRRPAAWQVVRTTGSVCGFFGAGMTSPENPVSAERNFIEETQRSYRDEDRTGRQFLLVGQVNLVVADMLGTQLFQGFFEMTREQGDLLQIRGLRVQGGIPHLHVFRHALSKGSHGELLCEVGCAAQQPFHASATEISHTTTSSLVAVLRSVYRIPRSGLVVCWACSAVWR
jgi:hypothetical protein